MSMYVSPIMGPRQFLRYLVRGSPIPWLKRMGVPFCRRILRLFFTRRSVLSMMRRKDRGSTS